MNFNYFFKNQSVLFNVFVNFIFVLVFVLFFSNSVLALQIGGSSGGNCNNIVCNLQDDIIYWTNLVGVPSGLVYKTVENVFTVTQTILADLNVVNVKASGDVNSLGSINASGNINATRINGLLSWAKIDSFPSACPAGQTMTGVGSSLTCSPIISGVDGRIPYINSNSLSTDGNLYYDFNTMIFHAKNLKLDVTSTATQKTVIDQISTSGADLVVSLGSNTIKHRFQNIINTNPNPTIFAFSRQANVGTFVGDVNFQIRNNVGGLPSTIIYTKTFTNAQWNALSTTADTNIDISSVSIPADSNYFYGFTSSTADASNYAQIMVRGAAVYTPGPLLVSLDFVSWITSSADMYFKLYANTETSNLLDVYGSTRIRADLNVDRNIYVGTTIGWSGSCGWDKNITVRNGIIVGCS